MRGQVYLISSIKNPLVVKVGRTQDWSKRRVQLKVGRKAVEELVVKVSDMYSFEKELHDKNTEYRLPGTEWFVLPTEQVKIRLHSDMLVGGLQIYPPLSDSKANDESLKEIPHHELPRDHPLNEQLEVFCEDWAEDFSELAEKNPWVVEWFLEWSDGDGYNAGIDYINPRGEKELMQIFSYELGEIHICIENYDCGLDERTWHHELLGRNYFDIPLKNSGTEEDLVCKNIFEFFELLNSLPYEVWPIKVKAKKLATEQESLELIAKFGPPPTAEEVAASLRACGAVSFRVN